MVKFMMDLVVDQSQPLPVVVCVGYSSEWWIFLSQNKLASGFMLTIEISRPQSWPQQEVDHSEPQQVVVRQSKSLSCSKYTVRWFLCWLQPMVDMFRPQQIATSATASSNPV